MGSTNVTNINIFINDVLDTTAEIPPSIGPNEVGTINVTAGLGPGDEVRVSGAQGSFVIGTVPGGAPPPPPCSPDGCNSNCPAGCTVAQDGDCGCQDGDGCCGIGCDSSNDNDCPPGCLSDGSVCTTGNQCCNGICEAGICVSTCGPCGAACSEGGYLFNDGTHTCDGSVNDACNPLNGVWNTCSQTGDNSDADCTANCQAGLSYCTSGGANPPFYWGRCIDLQNDDCSCGSCGNDCTAIGQICQAGVCVPAGGGGLVAFWAFDGDATDSSGNGNDGTLMGPTFVNGVSGSALNFDGIDDRVRVDDNPTLGLTDEFTFAAWIHPRTFGEGTPGNGYGRIFEKVACYAFYVRNASAQDQIAVLIAGSSYTSSSNAIQLGTWQYVTATFDANLGSNQVEFFVDGAPTGTATRNTPAATNTNRINIGNRGAADRTFDGIIDDLKIWNRPLTPAEISAEYSSYGAPPPAGPDTGWGQPNTFSSSANFHPATVRCMGGQAPNLPNMRIKSLHARIAASPGSASMAVYLGGTEGAPAGAIRQIGVYNQPTVNGWNAFTLPTEVSWPANTITWICVNTTDNIYYNTTSSFTTDFFTSHGRHDQGSSGFPATLTGASFSQYWYEFYLTYYQSTT
jgi:hypothetical protein